MRFSFFLLLCFRRLFLSSSRTRRSMNFVCHQLGELLEGASRAILSILSLLLGFWCLVAFCFLWVGGVPLLRFPCGFPEVLGWVGMRFFSCYLLHLASFSSRFRLGQHGLPTRNPPGPPPALFLGASALTHLLLGVVGWTRRGKGRGG